MKNLIKIKFIDEKENLISEIIVEKNKKIKAPHPKKLFYKFKEWSPEFNKIAKKDVVYKAIFEPINDENKNGIADEEEFFKIIKEITNNKEYNKRKEYKHHGSKSVYDHSIEVAYYTYKISKKLNIDYKSATIGAMLHDFYYEDWNTLEKRPLLKKHGFVHAHEALENSKKVFPDLLNNKVENSIERHMFPLNIIPPVYLESWIVTLSDKYVSLDVLKDYKILMSFFINKYRKGSE